MKNKTTLHSSRRRGFLKTVGGIAGGAALAGCTGTTGGGGFPQSGQEIGVIIPYSPGGGTDTVTRGIAPFIGKHFSETQDVDVNPVPRNVTGGGGVRAMNEHFQREEGPEPIAVTTGGILAKAVMGIGDANFEPLDFVYTSVFELPSFSIVTRNDVDVSSWDDMLSKAEEDGEFRVAGGGVGNPTHLAFTLLSQEVGIESSFVMFDGIAPALNSVMRGEADYSFPVTGSAIPFLGDESTDIKPLTVMDDTEPAIDFPETPLAPDWGIPNWTAIRDVNISPKAVILPPGTADDHADLWEEVMLEAASDPEFVEWAKANSRPVTAEGREKARSRFESKVNTMNEYRDVISELTQG